MDATAPVPEAIPAALTAPTTAAPDESAPALPAKPAVQASTMAAEAPPRTPAAAMSSTAPHDGGFGDAEAWRDWVAACDLRGPARILAENVGFVGCRDGVLALSIEPSDEHLKGPAMVRMLADALAPRFGTSPQIRFEAPARPIDSVRVHMERARDARQSAADRDFEQHPDVRRLVAQGGRIVPESVRPLEG
jgi:DNA polymerase-3 subunit gamma/tau